MPTKRTATAAARSNALARGSKRPANNVLAALSSAHWAIQPDALRMMVAIAARINPPIQAIEAERGVPLENAYDVELRDGIATIPVHGPMFRYADWFTYMSGGTTYEQLSRDYLCALNDPAVRGILWDYDTPGGEVHGCQGFASLVRAHQDVKPQAVFAAGDTCSAGYWGASAVPRIVAAPTSIIGSLGCCTIITDFSKWEQEQGIEEIQIVSSQSPNKNRDPNTPEGRGDIEVVLDALADVFLNDVAVNRNVSIETVLSDFGQGGVFVGAAAVSAGLADDVGVYEDVHTELRERVAGSSATVVVFGSGRAPTPATETAVATSSTPAAGRRGAPPVAAAVKPAADTGVDPNAPETDEERQEETDEDDEPMAGATAGANVGAPAAAPGASSAAAKIAKARSEGVKAENARVLGIQALRRNASEDATIAACVADPTCSIEAAALRLRNAEVAAGTTHLEGLRADESNTPAPKSTPAGSAEQNSIDALSDKIANAGKAAPSPAKR